MKNKNIFLKAMSIILIPMIMSSNAFSQSAKDKPSKPKVIIFDVNETLLDLQPLKKSVGEALNGNDQLLSLWFTTMLQYSLVHTLTEDYQDFGQIGAAALTMVAKNNGIEISNETAKKAIVDTITKLPAHADTIEALTALKKAGFNIVSLTNSSNKGVAAQFEFAGLTQYFDQRLSVEDVKAFKPAPITYEWALKRLEVEASDVLMVAAHPWDLAGAEKAGMQTAFIQRPATSVYPLVAVPDYTITNLNQLVGELIN